MDDILDHALAAFLDSLSPPTDAETATNKVYKPDRTSVTLQPTMHIEMVFQEAVETVTEWVDMPVTTPSLTNNIFPNGVKPAFRPRVASTVVENGAGRMVAKENMSYIRLLGVFLLVSGLMCVVNLAVVKVYRKYWGKEHVKIESNSPRRNGDLVRGFENRKRERRWRYDMSGFMKRHEVTGEERRVVEEKEKDWEDVVE